MQDEWSDWKGPEDRMIKSEYSKIKKFTLNKNHNN